MKEDPTEAIDLNHWKLFCDCNQSETKSPLTTHEPNAEMLKEIENLSNSNNCVINFIIPLSSSITISNFNTYLPMETIGYDKKNNLN